MFAPIAKRVLDTRDTLEDILFLGVFQHAHGEPCDAEFLVALGDLVLQFCRARPRYPGTSSVPQIAFAI